MSIGPYLDSPSTTNFKKRHITPMGCFLALLGTLLLMFFAFGVVGIFAIRRSVKQTESARQEERQWQLPPGQALPSSVKTSLSEVGVDPPKDALLAEIKKLVSYENGYQTIPVDLNRFILAIEHSNAAQLDWPIRMILRHQVAEDYLIPFTSGDNQLLHAEWTKPNQEARAFILTDSENTGVRTIEVLWLSRKDGQWMLFDRKDLLEPLSTADYFAVAYQTNDGDGDSYFDFHETVYELTEAQQVLQHLKSAKVAKPFSDMAKLAALNALERLEAWDEMEGLAKTVDVDNCKYGLHYRARIAAREKNFTETISCYRQLVDSFGWFPGLPQLLGKWRPESAEDRDLVRQCLARDVCSSAYNQHFKQAVEQDPEVIPEIATLLEASNNIGPRIDLLCIDGALSSQSSIERLLQAIEGLKKFDSAGELLAGLLACQRREWDQAARLLASSVDQRLASDKYVQLSELYLSTILESELLTEHCQALKEKQKFANYAANNILYELSAELHEPISKLMDWIEANEIELDRPYMVSTIRSMIYETSNEELALKYAVEVHEKIYDEFKRTGSASQFTLSSVEGAYDEDGLKLDEEEIGASSVAVYVYPNISRALSDEANWKKLRDQFPPDMAFLLRTKQCQLPCRKADLEEAIQWYEPKIEADDLWLNYYKYALALTEKDWTNADRYLSTTFEALEETPVWETLAGPIAPFTSDAELQSESLNTALRTGRVKEYLEAIHQRESKKASEATSEYFKSAVEYRMNLLGYSEYIGLLPKLSIEDFRFYPDKSSLAGHLDGLEIRRLKANGEFNAAWDKYLEVIQSSAEDLPMDEVAELVDIGLVTGKLGQLDLSHIELDSRQLVDMALAVMNKDFERFQSALKSLKESNSGYGMYEDIFFYMPHTREAIWENGWDTSFAKLGMLQLDVNHEQVDLCLVAFDDSKGDEECIAAIQSVLQQSDPTVQLLPTSTMKNCLAAWRLSKAQHESTVLLMNNQLGEQIAKNNSCWPRTRWTLAIQLSKPSSLGNPPPAAIAVGESLSSIQGSWGSKNETISIKPIWKSIPASGVSDFAQLSPMRIRLAVDSASSWNSRTNSSVEKGKEMFLEFRSKGILFEKVRVKVVEQDESSNVLVELIDSSLLYPHLQAGRRIHPEEYELFE